MDGDLAGLPLNEAGRQRALSWVPENFEVAELVCRPHSFDYSIEAGPSQLRWVPEVEDSTQRVVAFHGRLSMREQETDIWLDDRPRPSDHVRYSWSGFSLGTFEGNTLVQTTTHLKENYIRRWGPMRSDRATVRTGSGASALLSSPMLQHPTDARAAAPRSVDNVPQRH